MKYLISLIVLISLITVQIANAQPAAIQTITTQGQYQVLSLEDGEVLKTFDIPFVENGYNLFGILSQTDNNILFVGTSVFGQITAMNYYFSNQSLTYAYTIYRTIDYEFYIQQIGYDPKSNIAYVGGLSDDGQVSIFAFNFALHIPVQYSFSYSSNGDVPIGSYDIDSNTYYLLFRDSFNVTNVLKYNFATSVTSSFPLFNYQRGFFESIYYFDNQLFIANIVAGNNNIYTVNLSTLTLSLVLQTQSFQAQYSQIQPFVFDPAGYLTILSSTTFNNKPRLDTVIFNLYSLEEVSLNNNIKNNIAPGTYIINSIDQ